MKQVNGISHVILLLCFASFSVPSLALPKYERTTLPIPANLDDGEEFLIQEVVKLEVYQDADNPNQYYYVPPFHVRQYTRGAAGMLLHAHNIKEYVEAQTEIDKRNNFDIDKIAELRAQVEKDQEAVQMAERKLDEAMERGTERLIKIYEERLARELEALTLSKERLRIDEQIVRDGGTLLPRGTNKVFNDRISASLARAGLDVHYDINADPNISFEILKQAVKEFSQSYGGFISVNAYAGFTQAQVDALAAYKLKYAPNIKVSLLPVDKLSFFALTEWQGKPSTGMHMSKMFRQINGAGDYLGSALVMDTTIAGSFGLANHLAPFILPIGIRATFKHTPKPSIAELNCDFTTGYEVWGRADVKDGLVIFDNDITNTISGEDRAYGACNYTHISGDQDSAHFAALQEMEKVFSDIQIKRTLLAPKEKQAYLDGVMADIQNNRRLDEPTYTQIIRRFTGSRWENIIIEGITRAADFHWHTNIQDISNLSKVKFSKRIAVHGDKTIERDLPVNLCLVYNSELNAYDRCIPAEELQADNMHQSTMMASQSEACQNITDPFECGQKRDQAGETTRRPPVPATNDNILLGTM